MSTKRLPTWFTDAVFCALEVQAGLSSFIPRLQGCGGGLPMKEKSCRESRHPPKYGRSRPPQGFRIPTQPCLAVGGGGGWNPCPPRGPLRAVNAAGPQLLGEHGGVVVQGHHEVVLDEVLAGDPEVHRVPPAGPHPHHRWAPSLPPGKLQPERWGKSILGGTLDDPWCFKEKCCPGTFTGKAGKKNRHISPKTVSIQREN